MVLKMGKERLGDKAADEQRVNDYEVPSGRRTRARPIACPWDIERRAAALEIQHERYRFKKSQDAADK
jgi:hypothetical protein